MSNEFVSVPRDLLERIYEKIWPVHGVSKELRTLLDNADAGISASPADKGHGEPLAWLYKNTNMGNELSFQRLDHYYRPYTASGEHDYVKGIALYAEQPAPVAVVMPDRKSAYPYPGADWYEARGYNMCLDDVARLNGVKP